MMRRSRWEIIRDVDDIGDEVVSAESKDGDSIRPRRGQNDYSPAGTAGKERTIISSPRGTTEGAKWETRIPVALSIMYSVPKNGVHSSSQSYVINSGLTWEE